MDPPDSFSSPISLLNTDTLTLILSLIHVWPRIFVASLVCKRWRYVALRSVRKLPENHFKPMRVSSEALQLFSSLTSLNLGSLPSERTEPFALPHGVTEVTVRLTAYDIEPTNLDSLTAITQRLPGSVSYQLLTAARTSLRSLYLLSAPAALQDYYFPSLTSLATDASRFIIANSSQLRSLSVYRDSMTDNYLPNAANISFLHVTHLEVDTHLIVQEPFASVCSRLQSLGLTIKAMSRPSPPPPRSHLRSLASLWIKPADTDEEAELIPPVLSLILADPDLCNNVTTLSLQPLLMLPMLIDSLPLFKNLTHLWLDFHKDPPALVAPECLSCVTDLRITGRHGAPLGIVLDIARACPRLRNFAIITQLPITSLQPVVLALIRSLVQRGVEQIDVTLRYIADLYDVDGAEKYARALRQLRTPWTWLTVHLMRAIVVRRH